LIFASGITVAEHDSLPGFDPPRKCAGSTASSSSGPIARSRMHGAEARGVVRLREIREALGRTLADAALQPGESPPTRECGLG
jgi:hypothetical protein